MDGFLEINGKSIPCTVSVAVDLQGYDCTDIVFPSMLSVSTTFECSGVNWQVLRNALYQQAVDAVCQELREMAAWFVAGKGRR